MSKNLSNDKKKKSAFRLKKEKDIIYPVLHKCSLNENNDYWKQVFNDLSRGLCPKSITIKNGVITGNISRKNNIIYNFLNDNEIMIQNKIKELFSNIIKSDYQNNQGEIDSINAFYNDFKNMEWKNIKKKNIKEFLLQKYTIELKNKFNIKLSKLHSIYNTLLDSFYVYKTHSNLDIEYSDGIIHHISDIDYDPYFKTIINKRLEGDIIKLNSNSEEILVEDLNLEDDMDDKDLDSLDENEDDELIDDYFEDNMDDFYDDE